MIKKIEKFYNSELYIKLIYGIPMIEPVRRRALFSGIFENAPIIACGPLCTPDRGWTPSFPGKVHVVFSSINSLTINLSLFISNSVPFDLCDAKKVYEVSFEKYSSDRFMILRPTYPVSPIMAIFISLL